MSAAPRHADCITITIKSLANGQWNRYVARVAARASNMPLHYHRNACRRFHKEAFFDRMIVLIFYVNGEIGQFVDTRYIPFIFSSMPCKSWSRGATPSRLRLTVGISAIWSFAEPYGRRPTIRALEVQFLCPFKGGFEAYPSVIFQSI